MTPITALENYYQGLIGTIDGLVASTMVFTQDNLADTIRNQKDWPLLVGVVPSSRTSAENEDNVKDPHENLVFVIQKIDPGKLKPSQMIDIMAYLQRITEDIKKHMIAGLHEHSPGHIMHWLDPDGMVMEPEYNYLGCYGWSLSFTLKPPL